MFFYIYFVAVDFYFGLVDRFKIFLLTDLFLLSLMDFYLVAIDGFFQI